MLADPARHEAVTAPRVALVSNDGEQAAHISRLLRRTIGPIRQAEELEALLDTADLPLVVFVYDTMGHGQRSELLDVVARRRVKPVLLMLSAHCAQQDFASLFAARALTNLLVVREGGGVDTADLRVTVQKILRKQIFGLDKYLGWGVPIRSALLRGSHERGRALESVTEHVSQLGISPRLRELVRNVADEFLTNALYNAPITGDGAPRFADWPRTVPIELDPDRQVELRFGCDGTRYGLSVLDHFGSLSPERVQDYLAKAFRGGADQIHEGPGGAGLGLYQIFDSLSHFVINIDPGRRTEMIGLIDVSGSFRQFAAAGKSFNIFVQENSP